MAREINSTCDFVKCIQQCDWQAVADELAEAYKDNPDWFERLNVAANRFFDSSACNATLRRPYEKELHWIVDD